MKKSLLQAAFLFITASLYAASLAGATTFTVNGTNTPLAYTAFYDEPSGLVQPVAVTSPAGPWVAGSWISYDNPNQAWPMNSGSGNLPGVYYYLTSFDLTGLDPATALIKGSWAGDNGSKLYLNDVSSLANLIGTSSGYSALTNFTINSGFASGLNTLVFAVTNDPYGAYPGINPTGLLVNINEATANPVPEPSTLLLLASGLIGVAFVRRSAKN